MTDDYADWSSEVGQICAAKGIALPDEATLMNMYDDGVGPADVADPKLRERYNHSTRREQAGTVSDFLAQHRPSDT